ncbi:MAG: glycosyltransferase 87 family protein [Candidatus Kariarchaeaceae archaeon]
MQDSIPSSSGRYADLSIPWLTWLLEERFFRLTSIFFLLLYLILSLLNFHFLDFEAPWFSGLEVSKGTSFYDQLDNIFDEDEKIFRSIHFAHHPPVFIYVVAGIILLFGPYQLPTKIFIGLCGYLLGWLIYLLVKKWTDNELFARVALLLSWLNPALLSAVVIGLFEPFFLLLLLLACYFIVEDRPVLAGSIASLAALTKISGVLLAPVLAIMLIKKSDWKGLIKYCLAWFIVFGAIFGYFWSVSGEDFWYLAFTWQMTRGAESMSLIYYLGGSWGGTTSQLPSFWSYFIFIVVIEAVLLLLLFTKRDAWHNLFLGSSLIFISFSLVSRIVYPQYFLWFFVFLVFYTSELLFLDKIKQLLVLLSSIAVLQLTSLTWFIFLKNWWLGEALSGFFSFLACLILECMIIFELLSSDK